MFEKHNRSVNANRQDHQQGFNSLRRNEAQRNFSWDYIAVQSYGPVPFVWPLIAAQAPISRDRWRPYIN
jgi:hypothetical protein